MSEIPRDVWTDCTAFVGKHLCVILTALITGFSGTGVWLYQEMSDNLSRIDETLTVMQTDLAVIRYRLAERPGALASE